MEPWIPARVGDSVEDVDTPALVIDLDVLLGNLDGMAAFARAAGLRLRPHAKSHKCVALAKLQLARGAVGLCAQKVGEAEPFVTAGCADVLVTNEVVGRAKQARLAALAASHPAARLGVVVDDASNVVVWRDACHAAGARLDVYIELDVGQRRAGVETSDEVVRLAGLVHEAERLSLRGLHAYLGSAQHVRTPEGRRAATAVAIEKARLARAALAAAGLPCEIVTGGGTGSFPYESASGVYDELQPGSYALMDVDYAKNVADSATPSFASALHLWSTVMSVRGDRVTLDVGTKAQSTDCGPAQPILPGFRAHAVNDEHAILVRDGDGAAPPLGAKLRLVPGHVDPTVNLHDWFVVVRAGRVVDLWPIDARGGFY